MISLSGKPKISMSIFSGVNYQKEIFWLSDGYLFSDDSSTDSFVL